MITPSFSEVEIEVPEEYRYELHKPMVRLEVLTWLRTFFNTPFEELPLLINHESITVRNIAKERLKGGTILVDVKQKERFKSTTVVFPFAFYAIFMEDPVG